MVRSRSYTILAAGVFAFSAMAVTAPVAGATPFSDGCVATHGRVGSSVSDGVLHES
jgi:hypothetical protein